MLDCNSGVFCVKKVIVFIYSFFFVFISSSSWAMTSTVGYVSVTQLYLYGKGAQFYLSESCPTKGYYTLSSEFVDVNLYYSTLLAAYTTGKKVKVGWQYDSTNTYCMVRRMDFK